MIVVSCILTVKGGEKTIKKQLITKILLITILIGIFVVLTSVSSVSAASTVYVNATGGSDGNPGTIDSPYQTIGKGISSVEENGTVQLADGNYSGAGNTELTIDRSMTIAGQSQNKTIINGTGTNWIFHINPDVNVTITNLTLTNATEAFGGAIYNKGNLTVTNCTFTANTAYQGGAILNEWSTISLSDCNFTNNTAAIGGAITNDHSTITSLSGCTFTDNKATATQFGGGAICNHNSIINSLNDCTFTNNKATNNGGAIYNDDTITSLNDCNFTNNNANYGGAIYNQGTLTVNNCSFTSNKATISYVYGGGAIYNKGTITSLSGCTFTNNRAAKYGGAVYNDGTITSLSDCNFTGNIASSYSSGGSIFNYGTLTATNSIFTGNRGFNGGAITNQGKLTATGCTFNGNSATIGGAINNWDNATVTGSTFTDNTAYSGGAISNDEGTLIAKNCTFKGNTATGEGGAIYNDDTLTAHYNRFYNNTAPTGNAIYCYSGSVDADYNWWSSNLDPKTIQNLIYDPSNLVDTTNWVILNVNSTPTTINNTQNTTITADLNHYTNSTGYVGELSTHIPDGSVTLDIPWGSFTNSGTTHSVTLNTLEGVATATFYANEGAVNASYNPVKVTALADDYTTNDTESTYITINKITKLYLKTTSSSNSPKVGEKFLLTYKLGNKGPDAADNVTITFQLPEGLEFVNIRVDNGKCTYNETTRTVTWTLDSVPVGDPYLYLTVQAAGDGTYKITPTITSDTYDLNSGDYGVITFNVQTNNNSGNGTVTNTVNAASKTTIGLQKTGLPLNYLLLAVLIVLGGLVPKRK